jgi:hypothetical protein
MSVCYISSVGLCKVQNLIHGYAFVTTVKMNIGSYCCNYLRDETVDRAADLQAGYTKVNPKVSRLAAWSENYKWYSFLSLGAAFVWLFCESF